MSARRIETRALRPRRTCAAGVQRVRKLEHEEVSLEEAGGMWAAAVYLAIVAFPENTAKRTAFLEDIKAIFVREMVASGYAKRRGISVQARYAKRSPRALERSGPLVTATRRLERERLPAAGLAIDLLIARTSFASWLRIIPRRASIDVTSLGAASRGLAGQFMEKGWLRGRSEDALEDFANNFTNRGWRNSKPVLHLAIALQAAINEGAPTSVVELVRRPAWVGRSISFAERLRPMYGGAISLTARGANKI